MTLFQAQCPRGGKLQACVLEISLKVFPNCFICHVEGNSAKENRIVSAVSLLDLLLELGKEVPGPSVAGLWARS